MEKELAKTQDESGQVTFAAAVYFDREMSIAEKEYWLKECAYSSFGEIRADAIMYLRKLSQPLESEFIRPEKPIETRQTY
jgi:hypothetical protein